MLCWYSCIWSVSPYWVCNFRLKLVEANLYKCKCLTLFCPVLETAYKNMFSKPQFLLNGNTELAQTIDLIMAYTKIIYILIIEFNERFSFFLLTVPSKKIDNMFFFLLSSYIYNSCLALETRPVIPPHFSFSQTSNIDYIQLDRHRENVNFLFLT